MVKNFRVDIKGRVKNFDFQEKDALMPMYEAIVNSIHSLEEISDVENNYIRIYIEREHSLDIGDTENNLIENVIIEDNGVGFNVDNLDSFLTSDSPYKYEKGGKGIGRFTWLKAFENVHIESCFNENGSTKYISFDFNIKNDVPIQNFYETENNCTQRKTIVRLEGFKQKYSSKISISTEEVATRIINHCIQFLISKNCPKISICEGDKVIVLNELFKNYINIDKNKEKQIVRGVEFNILHVKVFDNEAKHKINLCAHNRVVKSLNLEKIIPNLSAKLYDEDRKYTYKAYVTSDYLDENVDSNRTDFSINNTSVESLLDDVSMTEIENIIRESTEIYLADELEKIEREKVKKIEEFTNEEEPRFKHLIKRCPEKIKMLRPGMNRKTMISELSKIQSDYKLELENDKNFILKSSHIYNEEYTKLLNSYLLKVDEYNKSALADYVLHRKSVIDILEKYLSIDDQGHYSKESKVHDIIFPMNATTDEVDLENHNLWLIDDKLAFHHYLTSDKRLESSSKFSSRPDLLIGNTFIEVDEKPFQSITIVELKRPDRNNYKNTDNPIEQVYNYVEEIMENNKKDSKGRVIKITDTTRFYLYVICDITSSLERTAMRYNLQKTPDNNGFFGYNSKYNIYVEVISFDKLLQDAKKRNNILFNKLDV